VTNVSIKSGTKDLHGTAYYNDSPLRAVPWHTNRFIYDPRTGPINDEKLSRNIPTWRHQRWGVTATGPVVIPRLYNGRQKTFWSFGYEGLKIRRNLGFTGTVPTEAQRQGNFSDLLKLGPNYQIYNPETIEPAGGGRFSRDPIQGNIIPEGSIDLIAKRIMEYWPLPNQPGTIDGRNNYFTTQDIDRNNRSILARVDHNFSENHRMFVRFNHNRQYDTTIPFESASIGTQDIQPGYGAVVDDVYTFNSSLLLNLRYGLSYQKPIDGRLTQGFDLSSLGFPADLINEINTKSNPAGLTFPVIAVTGYTTLGTDGGGSRSIYMHSFAGTLTKIAGAHSLKTGAEYRLMRENGFVYGNVSPSITFGEAYTRGPLDNSPIAPIGQGLASFLLGYATSGSVSLNASRAQQSDWTGVFIHDDWRVNSKLTLNLGVRYEYEGAPTERYNRSIRGFDFNAASPISERALATYAAKPIPETPVSVFKTLGGLTFPGVDGQPRGLWESDKNNFMPRIGLAYALTQKTVVRAGYGIYYDSIGIDRFDVNQNGFNQSTNLIPTLNNGQDFIATLANPFPNGLAIPPGSSQGLSTFLGRNISFYNEEALNPMIQRWSLSVQQELPGRMVAEVSYVGSRGTKLGAPRNINPIPRQYLSTKNERDPQVSNFLTEQVNNPFFGIPEFAGAALGNQRVARSQLLRPYPHFQDIMVTEPVGYSWYHSLQMGVEKRLTKGLTFQASWTYSKFMEAIDYLNPTDPRPEEVISDMDFPHRFVLNGIYELPFGKGRKWFNGASRWVDYAIGGWQLQGWFEGQSGQPLGFGNAIVRGDLRDIALPVSERTAEKWFDVTAVNEVFELRSNQQLENNIRTLSSRFSFIRADGVNNVDLSLFKNFQISEGVKLQFRVESFNALNHVQFAAPNLTVTNTAFGQINGEKGHGQRQVTFGLKVMF
ncbi:MAG TPA: TonB-dependent receptor, partial [Blastocatellia bacterium]